jgi:hypothetical protein
MRLIRRVIAAAGLLGLGVAGSIAAVGSTAAAAGNGNGCGNGHQCGYVYDNTTGTNTIAGFLRHQDGSLTPLPGSD